MSVRVCHVAAARHVLLLAEWWPEESGEHLALNEDDARGKQTCTPNLADAWETKTEPADTAYATGKETDNASFGASSAESLIACCSHSECRTWVLRALSVYASSAARNDYSYSYNPSKDDSVCGAGTSAAWPQAALPEILLLDDEHAICSALRPNGIVVCVVVRRPIMARSAGALSADDESCATVPDASTLAGTIADAIVNECSSNVAGIAIPYALSDALPAIANAVAAWRPLMLHVIAPHLSSFAPSMSLHTASSRSIAISLESRIPASTRPLALVLAGFLLALIFVSLLVALLS